MIVCSDRYLHIITYYSHLPYLLRLIPHTAYRIGMKLFDITKDGADEVIVGRDDGRLEVYTQDAGMERKTMQSFSKDIGAK